MTGKFIVLEGIDGAGTTTQLELLRARLAKRGDEPLGTREPTGGTLGKLIRQCLRNEIDFRRDTLALLFAADRLEHCREIGATLMNGQHVVSDRYVMSSIAYQSQSQPLEFVSAINAHALKPDLTLLVDVPAEIGMARVQKRGGELEIFEQTEFQKSVRKTYLEEASRMRDRSEPIFIVDGTGAIEAVFATIWSHVKSCIGLAD